MTDPLRHHRAHRKYLIGSSLAERSVQFIAEGIGTVWFLAFALTIIVAWIVLNGGYAFFSGALHAIEHGNSFDPAPWILLNLVFSFEAFFTGSLVVIAAKAQAKRDQCREEADANHREELHDQLVTLVNQNTELTRKVAKLTGELHAHLAPAPKPPTRIRASRAKK